MVIEWEREQKAEAARVVKQAQGARPSRQRPSRRKVKGVQVSNVTRRLASGSERNQRNGTWAARDKVNGVQISNATRRFVSGSERNQRTKRRVARDSQDGNGCSIGSQGRGPGVVQSKSLLRFRGGV
jgi:hypothetical protein